MKAHPILFPAPMVRALLEGRKTQTRRVIKLPKDRGQWEASTIGGGSVFRISKGGQRIAVPEMSCIWNTTTGKTLVDYAVGDVLWVREAWGVATGEHSSRWKPGTVLHRADHGIDIGGIEADLMKWRQGIHMPRQASRLTLEVTDVCVERLQDITEEDAREEGMCAGTIDADDYGPQRVGYMAGPDDGTSSLSTTGARAFEELWKSLNGPESWNGNPWVWALTFTVHKCNVDAFAAPRAA